MRLGATTASLIVVAVLGALRAEGAQSAVVKLPTFGVSMAAPQAGWVRIPEGGPGMAARWAKMADTGAAQAIITIEIEPLGERSEEQYVAGLVKNIKAKAAGPKTKLGEVEATRVVAAQAVTGKQLRPVEAIVAVQNKCAYVLAGMVIEGLDVGKDLEAARASWTWIKPEAPAKHLGLRKETFPVLGRFMMNVPEVMRPFPAPERGQMHLGVYNYEAMRPEFFVNVQFLAAPGGASAAFRELFTKQIQERMKLKKPLTWTTLRGEPARYVSSTMEIAAGALDPNEGAQNARYGLIDLKDGVALVSFTLTPAQGSDLAAYEKATEDIMKSVAPMPKE